MAMNKIRNPVLYDVVQLNMNPSATRLLPFQIYVGQACVARHNCLVRTPIPDSASRCKASALKLQERSAGAENRLRSRDLFLCNWCNPQLPS